jgi:hypothetical protein
MVKNSSPLIEPEGYYRVHNNRPLDPIVSQLNLIHNLTHCFWSILMLDLRLSAVKMETARFSKTLVSTYKSTRCHNPEEQHQILMLSSHVHLSIPSGLFRLDIPTKIWHAFLISHACHMSSRSDPPWFCNLNNIFSKVSDERDGLRIRLVAANRLYCINSNGQLTRGYSPAWVLNRVLTTSHCEGTSLLQDVIQALGLIIIISFPRRSLLHGVRLVSNNCCQISNARFLF